MSSRCADRGRHRLLALRSLRALPAAVPAALLVALVALLAVGCERENRRFETPARQPERNAWDVNEGKRLYRWLNCGGCHGPAGGGAYGPALTDSRWRYGASLDAIVATIRDGRPNGMPAFGSRLPQPQIRQLAAYVRSMSGQLDTDVAPARADSMASGKPESRHEREPVQPEQPVQPSQGASR